MDAGAIVKSRPDPNSPAYRKPVMIGNTAGLKPGEQFPEYEEWLKARAAKEAAKQ